MMIQFLIRLLIMKQLQIQTIQIQMLLVTLTVSSIIDQKTITNDNALYNEDDDRRDNCGGTGVLKVDTIKDQYNTRNYCR